MRQRGRRRRARVHEMLCAEVVPLLARHGPHDRDLLRPPARRGKCSEKSTPLMRVLIALNLPAFGLPGFGSKPSMRLGPPFSQSTMHAFAFGDGRFGSASDRPAQRGEERGCGAA